MSRGERNARDEDRRPVVGPYFGLTGGPSGWPEGMPGYSQPSPIDPTGYTVGDPGLDRRLGEVVPDDVTAPLGGPRVGRLAVSSYGAWPEDRPTPGGALGEAGAAWDRADYGGIPVGEYLAPQHAQRPAPLEYGRDAGVAEPHALPGKPTGLGTIPARDRDWPGDWGTAKAAPPGYVGGLADRHNLSDREVYDDLYGSGREFGLDEGGDRGPAG